MIFMNPVLGVCGCICSECDLFNNDCKGCHAIEGVACWLHDVGLDVCDFYACCKTDKHLQHCGECQEIPCSKFWANKNPEWTKEEHQQIVQDRVDLLRGLINEG